MWQEKYSKDFEENGRVYQSTENACQDSEQNGSFPRRTQKPTGTEALIRKAGLNVRKMTVTTCTCTVCGALVGLYFPMEYTCSNMQTAALVRMEQPAYKIAKRLTGRQVSTKRGGRNAKVGISCLDSIVAGEAMGCTILKKSVAVNHQP